jgi:RHS repeat-associated protein
VQELGYDAWGRRRDPSTWQYFAADTDAQAVNPWGFSGHEHIDLFGMVNMDGRMYDPMTGRFLSPDPFVQAPDFTQGLNRYSYCLNNPLSLTDPTGYSWLGDNWKSLVASAVGIVVSAVTVGSGSGVGIAIIAGAAGGAAGALTGALLNGANLGQVAKATLTGAFWGAVSGAFNYYSADPDLIAKLFKHTFTQGFLEGIQGGNAVHGMMMGAVSGAGGHYIDKYSDTLGKAGEIAASAVLGGTVDELGGGKFANGAITSAFSTMFNDMMHPQSGDDDITPQIDLENNQTFQLYNYEKPLEPVYPEFYFLLGGGKLLGDAIIDGLSTLTIKLSSSCTKYLAKKTAIRYTEHGLKQAISRGFTDADIKMVVKHGIRQTNNNARFGPQYKYTLNHNSVVVDKKTNKVITVFSDRRNIPGKPDGYIYK